MHRHVRNTEAQVVVMLTALTRCGWIVRTSLADAAVQSEYTEAIERITGILQQPLADTPAPAAVDRQAITCQALAYAAADRAQLCTCRATVATLADCLCGCPVDKLSAEVASSVCDWLLMSVRSILYHGPCCTDHNVQCAQTAVQSLLCATSAASNPIQGLRSDNRSKGVCCLKSSLDDQHTPFQ